MYNRRQVLAGMGGVIGLGLGSVGAASQSGNPSRLGICTDSYSLRRREDRSIADPGRRFFEPMRFLEYCHGVGAGGVQVGIGARDEGYARQLHRQAERWGMFVEGAGELPRDQADVERFEAEVVTAKNAGAAAIRAVMPSKGSGRRYEAYASVDEFRQTRDRGRKMLELAEPVMARHHIRLAAENHKDERVPEKLETIKHISSEYVGICVDTGNDIAFLEDPMEVVEAYAPWAFSVHLKDASVREYEEGFLLGDVPLGEGIIDLPKMVRVLRSRRPEVHFTLEMMTRDPLKVPCLTEGYWSAMGDIPGPYLARTLRMARAQSAKAASPPVGRLSMSEQYALEDANVRKCLAYARERLGL